VNMKHVRLTSVVACLMLASAVLADVAIIDVTKESQAKDKIDWFGLAITTHAVTSSLLVFTVSIQKDVARMAENVTLNYTKDKKESLLSIPVATRKQKDGSFVARFTLAQDAVTNCTLQFTSVLEVIPGEVMSIDEYNVQLATYLVHKKESK